MINANILRVILIAVLVPYVATASPKEAASVRLRLIGGTWARHLDEKLFFVDGTYESHDREHDKPTHGRWRLEGKTLIMTEGGETTKHRIISVTATDLDMTFGDGSEGLHYRRSSK